LKHATNHIQTRYMPFENKLNELKKNS
jgi:hypothetical protein